MFTLLEWAVLVAYATLFVVVVVLDLLHRREHAQEHRFLMKSLKDRPTWASVHEMDEEWEDSLREDCIELRAMIDSDRSRIQAIADDYKRVRDLSNAGISPEVERDMKALKRLYEDASSAMTIRLGAVEDSLEAVNDRITVVEARAEQWAVKAGEGNK